MQQFTPEGQNLVNNLAGRYNLSIEAVIHMIIAVSNGGGTMAQFNCPELGGSGQWMRGGMTMVGDMFNYGLKNTVNNLCAEISNALMNTQIFPIIPAGTSGSNQWWPTNLGSAFSSGGQNNIRYAVFPQRLAVELNGQVTVYDTLNHNISGVSQQQGGDTSLTFTSQYGTVSVATLPIISGTGVIQNLSLTNFAEPDYLQTQSQETVAPPQQQQNISNESSNSIVDLIEKLAKLHAAGILSDDEFFSKKAELLNRL
ncbi:MAG TPA: hypothetical protein CFH84_01420 [Sulfurimonas sp. UBA12504]|nr:MAG: hypothetical protein A2019_03810 [Sulfurimonas sp. GWF2_37_8]DAB30915.1 MAG TPA: hypothetical protein CFH84_01420 [Sulfurimonas sp. UBA12504]